MSDLERELLELKKRVSGSIAPSAEMASHVFQRARARRAITAITGVLAAGVLGLASLAGVNAFDAPPSPGPVGPQPVESPTLADLNPRVTASIPVGQFPTGVAIGEGSIWVTVNNPDPPNHWVLARIDPNTNEIVETIPLEGAADVDVGAGSVWVLGYQNGGGAVLWRIDPQTNTVAETIPLDCVADLEPPECFAVNVAVNETGVWVTLSADPARSGELVHIEPATSEVVARIPFDEGSPRDVVLGEGAVWVYVGGEPEGGSLVRIDPHTNGIEAIILRDRVLPTGGAEMPPVIAVGDGDVWVTRAELQEGSESATLAVRIDVQTNEVIAESQNLTPRSGTSVFPFAVGEGGLWFYGGGDAGIRRLNGQTLEVDESVSLDRPVSDALLDPATSSIWVASYEGPLIRIDLR